MIFNILAINDALELTNIEACIKSLDNKELFLASDAHGVDSKLKSYPIHLIVLDLNIVSLEKLSDILEKSEVNNIEIPILINSNNKTKIDNKLLIYDCVDRTSNQELFFNKIKFCHSLYKKELQHETNMQRLLYIDNLTQLPNRTKLIKDIQNNDINIISLAIIDINAFKEINDFFGHKIGDNILKSVALIIKDMIKYVNDKVILYKFPSDAYCIANKVLEQKTFQELVIYILHAIDNEIFRESLHEIDLRATAGLTFSTKNNKLITADIALQAAKKDHKDYLVFYDELDNLREYQNNMLWSKKLKQALEKDDIIVYYQPLVNNITKKVDKYECLVRMVDEDKIISPFFFLEISKKTNQYFNITKTVIEKSFKEFENLPFEFSVNVSYEDIENEDFLDFVKKRFKTYDVAHKVVWEILEDEGIKNYDVLLNFISEVKSLGCKVAIDDFGSGYSNFEHLLKMDVDYLKIDASLIKNVATDENSYRIVKTIIEFAKSLNLKTIAEYVENKEIFDINKRIGSYLFSRILFCSSCGKT